MRTTANGAELEGESGLRRFCGSDHYARRRVAAVSKIEALRQHVMRLYREHLAAGMLPTSIRFLFYELVALSIVAKQASGVLRPGAVSQRRTDQDVIDAITDLRESGEIPWDAIVDETRSINDYTRPGSPIVAMGSMPT